jgi:hypothetical protein
MDTRPLTTARYLPVAELIIIILLAIVPLFVTFPYRVNIFLSWEGAYRMSQGQLPFRDYGMPLGGMYWVIPAIFFKLFGAKMITLVKAQVFINIISGLAFRSILKSCKVQPGIRMVSVLLYCISYSFFNFWPWYNHSVIVYEFVGLAFLLKFITTSAGRYRNVWLLLAALFTCFSFLTKQDAGGMTFGIACVLLTWHGWTTKKWLPLPLFVIAFTAFFMLVLAPVMGANFGYWFNHGQPPHTARVSVIDLIKEFFGSTMEIKFYLFLIVLILVIRFRSKETFWKDKEHQLFLLLTLCILGEAFVFEVTSYTPPDNNIFFHSFAIAYILSSLAAIWPVNFNTRKMVMICSAGVLVWWSHTYWKYIERIVDRAIPPNQATVSPTGENIVNMKTFMIVKDTTDIPMSEWKFTGLKAFDKIYMPGPTVDGIHRLMSMDLVKQHKDLKVLNMSELTPLAQEIPFKLERNPELPLWHHLGVGMFNKQAQIYEQRIGAHYYDLVLFEYIPTLNNFYPFRVRDSLKVNYKMVDSFFAPRRGNTTGMIEVYVKP